jgi:ATP-dependent RNA helicase RhlE
MLWETVVVFDIPGLLLEQCSDFEGDPMSFSDLGLGSGTVAVLDSLGFTTPTEIQQKAIPVILSGRDLMASAETGSGKTAAYALPSIQSIKGSSEKRPRILVLVPTRELAIQVETQFQRFSNNSGLRTVTIYGGTGYEKQTRQLRRGVDVVIATPGRLTDHMERENVKLSNVQVLIMDEADRMLDMGFTPQVRRIVDRVPEKRQTLMFSATISASVEQTAAEFLIEPVTVFVNTKRFEPTSIEQRMVHTSEVEKPDLLLKLIKEDAHSTVLVFARTRHRAAKIRKKLCASEILAEEIHSDISQNQREKTLSRFREGLFSVLVATDVASRGLDVPAINHVVNYDLPDSPADYVHRIGRTGRAGRSGTATSFVSADQIRLMRNIERLTGHTLGGKKTSAGSGENRAGAEREQNRKSRDSRRSDRSDRGFRSERNDRRDRSNRNDRSDRGLRVTSKTGDKVVGVRSRQAEKSPAKVFDGLLDDVFGLQLS